MQAYREGMKEKGLVQVRVWVEKQDENFVKYIAKFCREFREKKEKKRYGRRVSKQGFYAQTAGISEAVNLMKDSNILK
jgi:hypothetical protein